MEFDLPERGNGQSVIVCFIMSKQCVNWIGYGGSASGNKSKNYYRGLLKIHLGKSGNCFS